MKNAHSLHEKPTNTYLYATECSTEKENKLTTKFKCRQ